MAKKNSNAAEANVDNTIEAAAGADVTETTGVDISTLDKAEMAQLIEQLSARNKALEATKGDPNPVVQLPQGVYLVKGGARVRGRKYTAKELSENPALCEELVESGSELLQRKA